MRRLADATTQAQRHRQAVGPSRVGIVAVVVVLFDADERWRLAGCGIGLGTQVDVALIVRQLLIVHGLEGGAMGLVIALLELFGMAAGGFVDQAFAALLRVLDQLRRDADQRVERRFRCWRRLFGPLAVQRANGQEQLRGLLAVGQVRVADPVLAAANPAVAQTVEFLRQADRVVQFNGQHAVGQLMLGHRRAQVAFQGRRTVGATEETMHAGEALRGLVLVEAPFLVGWLRAPGFDQRCGSGLELLVFIHLLVDLQVVGAEGEADAGGVVAGSGEVELMKALRCAPGLVGFQYAARPGIAGKRQPGCGVGASVDIEERRRDIVIGPDAGLRQQGLVGNRRGVGVDLVQIAIGRDLVGLPDSLVEQHVEVTGAQGAQPHAGVRPRIGRYELFMGG
ncbi:hypothetical protein D3C78_701780 [compost metagenome]